VALLGSGWVLLAVYLFAPGLPSSALSRLRDLFAPISSTAYEPTLPNLEVPGLTLRLEKVAAGETYASLAGRLGVSEAALRSLNQANDGSQPTTALPIYVPSQDGVFHWIVGGEGWSDIARAYGLPLGSVLSANRKGGAGTPKSGEVLYLPGGIYLDQEDPRWKTLMSLRSAAGFQKPTSGRFADGFGLRRHPVTSLERFHEGLDLAPGAGAKVVASQKGRVVFAGMKGKYGNLISLDHGEGITSHYAHLSEIKVQEGQTVSKGEWIGRVGATGRVTGPHLHFEIRKGGKPQNPLLYLEK